MEKTLFLHWGPGGNAQAELNSFSSQFPSHYVWWDQPVITTEEPQPYQAIVSAALEKVSQLYAEKGGPIRLAAHSFGAQLALEIARRAPEKVSQLTLFAALANVPKGYVHLGKLLSRLYQDSAIRDASEAFEKNSDFNHFAGLVAAVTQHPDFLSHYWGTNPESVKAREVFFKNAERHPPLNFEMFMTVMKDLFDSGEFNRDYSSLTLPIEIHLGREDPYFEPADAIRQWQKRFPQATIKTHPSGHFVHLESKTEWT